MKTSKINLVNLHNEEHFQFQTDFKTLIAHKGAHIYGIEAGFANYLRFYNQEGEAIQLIHRSTANEQLTEADDARDEIFRGLKHAIRTATNHFKPEKRASAKRIAQVVDHYGNIGLKTYNEETSAISKLILELRSTYYLDLTTLGLTDWVTELSTRNMALDFVIRSRHVDAVSKSNLKMKLVRSETDASYYSITKRLNALMLINGSTNYENLVRELNLRIEKYERLLDNRKEKTMTRNDKAVIETNISAN